MSKPKIYPEMTPDREVQMTPADPLARSVVIHLHTASPFTYWVRRAGEKWKWVEVESPEHVWELVGEDELFVSPIPWPSHVCHDRLIQVFPSDTGPHGFEGVARLSFFPTSVVPE